ncbi:hypothetical protein RN001_007493 [Aquatica leii]|uniref:Aladin seven-bladed propeller domain-containing protein n=1 Tax=Aquatica leii TaxID=1421715 RepID=A0AAN7SFD9_9COLE|nr:hypothetical protein RN001_007493 [Aquatica leii]
MDNLSVFQPPVPGEVTLCEVDGRTHSMNYEYANVSAFTTSIEKHPNIRITGDMIHSLRRGNEAKSLFLPVQEPFLKRLVQAYSDQGVVEVLSIAKEFGPVIISNLASVLLNLINGVDMIRSKLTLKSIENPLLLLADISQTRSWLQSSIRCIAWHDYHTKIAVATSDDVVRIYSNNSTSIPVLKCKQQKNITCLACRPLSNLEIAVGCENGILIWSVDHSSLITKHSLNNVTLLHKVSHKPVVSLAWNKGGDILASASACDSAILMWNVEMNETSSLKEPSGYGNCVLKWSPIGNKLFSATSNLIFRVWECQTWKSERWNVLTGRIQACCWSPCGSVLLFVTNTEPIIYALSFVQSEMIFANSAQNSPNQAIPVYDLSKGDLNGLMVGGLVTNIEWDPKCNYVAVLFHDTSYIAIFRVSVRPAVKLLPCCLVVGCLEEKPVCIAFQGNFQGGACLSIGWSSGRIQHFPIIHSELQSSLNTTSDHLNTSSFYNSFNACRSFNTSRY